MAGRRANGEGGAPIWNERRRLWKADYTANGVRRSVYSSAPGPKGAAECRDKRNKAIAAAAAGAPRMDPRRTLADWLNEWLRVWVRGSQLDERSIVNYEADVEHHIIPAIGARPLVQLRGTDVKALDRALVAKGLSGTTRQLVYDTLNRALKRAVLDGRITTNPCAFSPRPHRDTAEVEVWSVDEVGRVLAAAEDDRLEGLFAILLILGLRKGEALGLRWDDVDFEANVLRVSGQRDRFTGEHKARKGHAKPLVHEMPDLIRGLLWARQTAQKRERMLAGRRWRPDLDEDYVFTTRLGRPLSATSFDRAWRALVERAGVRYVKPHGARHFAASAQYMMGARHEEVAAYLGHADDSTVTRRYVHLSQRSDHEAAERMNRLFPVATVGT